MDLAEHIDDRSARGIAGAVGRLITAGDLPVGSRLPTVRELSRSLGVSPTTVSEAWQTLASVGALDARGRRGTYVREPTGRGSPVRYRRVAAPRGTERSSHLAVDLSTGTPHPDLLPDLGPIIARVSRQSLTSSYLDSPVLPALDEVLRESWPFAPDELTVVDGALDALDRILGVVVRLGDRVVLEHPTFPPLLDLLERLGAEVIGVGLDAQGMELDALRAAIERGIRAVVLQPRAQNPSGVSMTAARAKAIARLLAGTDVVVVEDDHSGGDRQRSDRQRRCLPAGADRAHPQLLQEPRARPAPRRRRRGQRDRHRGGQPPPARPGVEQPHPPGTARRDARRRHDRCHRRRRPCRVRPPAGGGDGDPARPRRARHRHGRDQPVDARRRRARRARSPSPPRASASPPAIRSWCTPTTTTSASRSASSTTTCPASPPS